MEEKTFKSVLKCILPSIIVGAIVALCLYGFVRLYLGTRYMAIYLSISVIIGAVIAFFGARGAYNIAFMPLDPERQKASDDLFGTLQGYQKKLDDNAAKVIKNREERDKK